MELTEENVEKLNVGNHPGALLCKGLLLDAITAGYALEVKVKNLEAEREISNSYDDAWKMAERIHELEKALESRQKIIEELKAQNANLAKALSESAIGHDWLNEKELIEADNAAMKKRIKELENKNKNLQYSSDMWMACCKLMSEGKRNVMSSDAIAEMQRIKNLEAENERLRMANLDNLAHFNTLKED